MNKRLILWCGLLFAMAIIVFAMFQIADKEDEITEAIRPEILIDVPEILDVREKDWIKGNPNADVVIVKYSDFQCPACRFYAGWDNMLSDEFSEDVVFVVRYFPLRSFQNSRLAAQYTEAAGRQGQFWEMHDLMYINQVDWSGNNAETIFRQYAESLKLDMDKLSKDVQNPEITERIENDYNDGIGLGIRGVPSIYINGEEIRLPNSLDAYRNLIEMYL